MIADVQRSDSGNYTCTTDSALPSLIVVYVSDGRHLILIDIRWKVPHSHRYQRTYQKVGIPSLSTYQKVGIPSLSTYQKVGILSISTYQKVGISSRSIYQKVGIPSLYTYHWMKNEVKNASVLLSIVKIL